MRYHLEYDMIFNMGKRGPQPMGKVKIKWSPNFAYAIGLIATDGCLSIDGRHIDFTSKDLEQVKNFMITLEINIKIGFKKSGSSGRQYFRVQFGDKNFYDFLVNIGITPKKSKTISLVKVPKKYFFDFLRGCFDGDGSFFSYWDKRWRNSFMFYTMFYSASRSHIYWLKEEISNLIKANGYITKASTDSVYQLRYAKKESLKLISAMYYDKNVMCLSRKKLKINKAIETNNK